MYPMLKNWSCIKLIIDRKESVPMYFRSWELYEYPTLPETDRHVWTVKTSTQINTPRFIILGFQTNRENEVNADKSKFIRSLQSYRCQSSFKFGSISIWESESWFWFKEMRSTLWHVLPIPRHVLSWSISQWIITVIYIWRILIDCTVSCYWLLTPEWVTQEKHCWYSIGYPNKIEHSSQHIRILFNYSW